VIARARATPQCACSCPDIAIQKPADREADLRRVRFKGEVAGFVKTDFRIRNVTLECLGSGGQENRVVPAQTASSGGRRARKYSWNRGYSATLPR
jgi:hypothetical protein